MRAPRILAAVALTAAFLAREARADERVSATDSALAQRLFEEARAMMADKKWEEACPKLAASQRLDPGVGTLLNLAECYEHAGRTASAWATYREAEAIAQRENQIPRARFAATHAEALQPRLARVTVRVEDAAKVSGLVVRYDGGVMPDAAWGTAVPLDAGEHVIEASAPERKTFSKKVSLVDGAQVEVVIPPLTPAPVAQPEPATAPRPAPSTSAFWPVVGWSLLGAGALAAGAGTFFGMRSFSRDGEANRDHCSAVDCDQAGLTLIDGARSDAFASTLLFTGAAVAIAGGVVVLLLPSRASQPAATGNARMAVFAF